MYTSSVKPAHSFVPDSTSLVPGTRLAQTLYPSTLIPRLSRNISFVSVDFQGLTTEDGQPLRVLSRNYRES